MSALAQEATPCVCGFDHLCGCGCGKELNPLLRRTHELVNSGASVARVARILGVTPKYVRILQSKPPRFVKGHQTKSLDRGLQPCANCGEPFHSRGPNHLYCTAASARPRDEIRAECSRLAFAHKRKIWDEYDAGVDARAAVRDAVVAINRAAREHEEAIANLLSNPYVVDTPDDQVARIDTAKALAKEAADEELAQLIEEQERDERWGGEIRKWEMRGRMSLDERIPGEFGSRGPEWHDFVGGDWFANAVAEDPVEILIASEEVVEFHRVTGGREIADVMRMDSESLYWLQERLRQAGLSARSVQAKERERLRSEERHSGDYVKAAGSHGQRKTRRQKIEHKQANRNRGNSNRPAQKPPKRWART